MENDKVPYPEIYKDKWLKFDKTVLYPMEINDCNDTIDGVCFENLTLDECTEKCVGDCDFGYHVKVDNKSICVPIRSTVHRNANPAFRLRNQNIYGFKDNVDVTFFQNKDVYPYPPLLSSTYVHFMSSLNIREYDNKNSYMQTSINKKKSDILMSKNNTIMTIRPKLTNDLIDNWSKIKYGEYVTIHIPETTLLLRQHEDDKIGFEIIDPSVSVKEYQTSFTTNRLFYFEDVNNTKDEYIKWFEPVYIKTIDDQYLHILNNKVNVSIYGKNKTAFCLTPQLIPYYCDTNICKNTEIQDVTISKDGNSLETKNFEGNMNKIYFDDNCWGECGKNTVKTKESNNINTKKSNFFAITLILSIVFVLLVLLVLLVIKNHE
jgi:hypothetical protein